jgi:hypothetical protein
VAGDSDLAEAVKIMARAHQAVMWTSQRQLNSMCSALRELLPRCPDGLRDRSGLGRCHRGSVRGPDPRRRLSVSKISSACAGAGTSATSRPGLTPSGGAAGRAALNSRGGLGAYGTIASSALRLITSYNAEIATLEEATAEGFKAHSDAEIVLSLPGIGTTLGARVLGEFGDDPNRYASAMCRKNYAGTSPITKASGRSGVALGRHARNRGLADALHQWAFCSLTHSPGARRYYDELRARGKTHHEALRQLANRWVGILRGCLACGTAYREEIAWRLPVELAA